ncbi:hypothetical protein [Vibrio sp. 10N.261.55.A7]|uniref:hypothetical protein n=1 Tax=Vibrio sp. 10N.261.55.A7 TaxID=1880851 RepID=UPI000C861F82|nr:hypothetical protein [Vibrio sp. 10N.261.55.A7]PMJ88898.1 hypothetical protein BCU12_14430 [Vibrio sp. 10N.261.55.A7]
MKQTDWNEYYSASNVNFVTSLTRKNTSRTISRILSKYLPTKPSVTELGGGNSCISDDLVYSLDVDYYEVVDNCNKGLDLFSSRQHSCSTGVVLDSVLSSGKKDEFDLCISIGLIEHFDHFGTSKAIRYHFDKVKSGGIVMITFPHPTWLYRLSRNVLEKLNKWYFPDERPLDFKEVECECDKYGQLLHKQINWNIVLTQGYVVYKKR